MKNMWKWIMMVFMAILLVSPTHSQLPQAQATSLQTAYIDVAVATLWTKPHQSRPIDQPSTTNPVDLRTWTNSMTLEEKLWLVGKLETQALLGNQVTVTDRDGDWVKVVVHGQPTPRDERGYPGWLPIGQLTSSPRYQALENAPFVLVTAPTAILYKEASLTHKGQEVSFNTRLPLLQRRHHAFQVKLPNGQKRWIDRKDGEVYASEQAIPDPSPTDLVNTAKQFLRLPYLWAGMSGFGFDCSGFTFTVYQSHGITVPRDASPQYQAGKPVDMADLQPGDLLFYATDQGNGSVHHVSMYIGNGQMIHSPNSARSVEVIPMDTPGYQEEFVGARRYLN